jgi:hypothetical protein
LNFIKAPIKVGHTDSTIARVVPAHLVGAKSLNQQQRETLFAVAALYFGVDFRTHTVEPVWI